jgi:N-acetylglucosamine kinase-like BadF-type ATPase
MVKYFLGYDIGGTNSRALVADDQGNVVGLGRVGSGSYEVVGWEGLQDALHAVTDAALDSAGIDAEDVAGAGFGIAGYDWPSERPPHMAAIHSLPLDAPFALVNDAMLGLVAGASSGWGIAIVAGTGANCWGRNRKGRLGHTTGGAALLGEYGGADTLVPEAIRKISCAFTHRGPTTALSESFVNYAEASDVEDLLEGVYVGRYEIRTDAAPLIFEAADDGDTVAIELIRWAGRELGSLAIGVARQLDLKDEMFEVVQIGSLFGASSLLNETMMATLHKAAPGARPTQLRTPPVVGGVLLGMEAGGLDVTSLREPLIKAAVAFMAKLNA